MTPIDLRKFTQAWGDEFEGATLDSTKWYAPSETRQGASRWVPSLVRVADGNLHLDIQLTTNSVLRYDCGAVQTRVGYNVNQILFATNGGYIEARCKMPIHLDADYWAAFWIMAGVVSSSQTDTRLGHELDIMETFNLRSNKNHSVAMHWGGYTTNHNSAKIDCGDQPSLRDGAFHTFGLLWTADMYTFYVDGNPVGSTDMLGLGKTTSGLVLSQGICTKPGILLLTVEAAAWPGLSSSWEANMPAQDEFVIDYVRVYRENAENWKAHYFPSNPVAGAWTNHFNGNRLSNLEAYIAGCDPTNRNDVFQVNISFTNSMPVVWFPTRTTTSDYYGLLNRHYALEQLTTLLSTNWSRVSGYEDMPAGPNVVFTNSMSTNSSFYRSKVWLE